MKSEFYVIRLPKDSCAIAGIVCGAGAGVYLGSKIIEMGISHKILLFFFILVLVILAVKTVNVVVNVRKEKNHKRSYPSNFGFDKSLEK